MSTLDAIQRRQRSMENTVQLLILYAASAEQGAWKLHLETAASLLGHLLNETSALSGPSLEGLLQAISKASPSTSWLWTDTWSPDQLSFRFFVSLLLFIDILGSTALEEIAAFEKDHYYHLISMRDDGMTQREKGAPIEFSNFTGVSELGLNCNC